MRIGQTHTSMLTVEEKHLACHIGSGDLRVLATPVMMSLMENAAMLCVADSLDEDSSTVGSHIASTHIRPTGIGHTVSATAELTSIEGRKLTFRVIAEDESGVIGEGTHIRYIILRDRFMAKV